MEQVLIKTELVKNTFENMYCIIEKYRTMKMEYTMNRRHDRKIYESTNERTDGLKNPFLSVLNRRKTERRSKESTVF